MSVLRLIFIFIFMNLSMIVLDIIHYYYYSRKCKFDCDKCKYWPCPHSHCKKRREKNEMITGHFGLHDSGKSIFLTNLAKKRRDKFK